MKNQEVRVRWMAILLALSLISLWFCVRPVPVRAQEPIKIVFDYSHGQYREQIVEVDLFLESLLDVLGYEVVWAYGGINASILEDAAGLILGAIHGEENILPASEVSAIADWFNAGEKFLWVGYDSDFDGTYINDCMTDVLEGVGSHVYGEPTSLEDPVSNAGAGYRVIANGTSNDFFVLPIVVGIQAVLMHGPTLLYGSDSDSPAETVNPTPLETETIENVYPLLYYGGNATIVDTDSNPPYAHEDEDTGAFVAATLEVNAGESEDGTIVVSGASPYGGFQPMCSYEYQGMTFDGHVFVTLAINFGLLPTSTTTTISTTTTSTTTITNTTTTTSTTTTASNTVTTTTEPQGFPVVMWAITLGSVAVIVVFGYLIYRSRSGN